MSAAKVILAAKLNSQPFEDRVILLDVPAKIGRSHKEEQADSGNAFFDCKVLSRQHAMILYEEDSFHLLDNGSSNGSFVNNIRLSKAGEESKLTRIYSNDLLRFGSDVTDKAKQLTQKCIVCKLTLVRPDGSTEIARPSESRLFRPSDAMEDLHAITQTLQESLTREKVMEDKLIKIKSMISRNIGKTHTDLLRLFENVKQEVINMQEEGGANSANVDAFAYEKIVAENLTLNRRTNDLEQSVEESNSERNQFIMQQQEDAIEIATLRKACQLQKQDNAALETAMSELQDEMQHFRIEAGDKLTSRVKELQQERAALVAKYEGDLAKQEEIFMEERTRIKEQLHDVVSNEVNLINRIKCLEAEENYSHVEVERILTKEREMNEVHQTHQHRIESLETELKRATQVIEEQRGQVVVKRFDEDVEKIAEQEASIAKLREEAGYLRQELIEARARKSASDDELGTVRGKVETLENNIGTLSSTGVALRKTIDELQEQLEMRTKEADHLTELVRKMEASATQDEVIRTEINDLKHELAKAEASVQSRNDDIVHLKREQRQLEETLQQKEIDLSCLRGQVQNIQEEMDGLKEEAESVASSREQHEKAQGLINDLNAEMDSLRKENETLDEDLRRQRTLYGELKKMRGWGEELESLQQCQQELFQYQNLATELEDRVNHLEMEIGYLNAEKANLVAASTGKSGSLLTSTSIITPGEAALQTVGSLRLYELTLGLIFLIVIIDWTFF